MEEKGEGVRGGSEEGRWLFGISSYGSKLKQTKIGVIFKDLIDGAKGKKSIWSRSAPSGTKVGAWKIDILSKPGLQWTIFT